MFPTHTDLFISWCLLLPRLYINICNIDSKTCFICLSGTGLPHSHSVLVLHVQYPLGSVRILNLYQYPRHYELKDHEYGCENNCKVGCQDLLVYAMVV